MTTPPLLDYERSQRGCSGWLCPQCGTYNQAVVKRLFKIPLFKCANINCHEEYLSSHDLDFSLADVKVNGLPLVPRIFNQIGPECVPNALCQMLQINFMVDSGFANRWYSANVYHPMRNLDPEMLYSKYYRHFTGHEKIGSPDGPCVHHKPLKMLHYLRKYGIRTKDGQVYKVGDVTFFDRADYSGICEELADGVPLLATIIPGYSFQNLKYGQFYTAPRVDHTIVEKLRACNQLHDKFPHASHEVVLIGPGTDHETKERGFWAINSWPKWCERGELPGFNNDGYVTYGVGLIPQSALKTNVVKLWYPGQSAPSNSFRLVNEGDRAGDLSVRAYNYHMLEGNLAAPVPPPYNDKDIVYCPHLKPIFSRRPV